MLLSEAIHGFYLYELATISPVTAENYRRFLTILCNKIGDRPVEELLKQDILNFLTQIANTRTGATVEAYWCSVRSFYKWANVELNLPRQDDIPCPTFENKPIIPFTRDEIQALIKAARSKRDKALVLILLDSGLRVSEMCRLQMVDLDLEKGTLRVRPWRTGLKSKARIVRIGLQTRQALWSYHSSRSYNEDDAPVISTLDGHQLERFGVRSILYRIAKRAKVGHVNPHKFRHTFAIQFLKNGGNIFELQELLGHRSLVMVRRYLHISEMDLEEAHKRASPVDRWKLK